MSVETPKPNLNNNDQYSDVDTPSADQLSNAFNPDHRTPATTRYIEERVDNEDQDSYENRKRRRTGLVFGGIALGVGLVGVGGFVAVDHMSKQQEQPAPNDNGESILPGQEASAQPTAGVLEPSPSSPANITPLETAPVQSTHEQAVAALEIEAGQDQEQISQSLIDRISKWDMAGSDEAQIMTMLDQGYAGEREIYADKIAAEQKEIYAEAIFGKDWQSNEKVQDFITKQQEMNARILSRHIITSNDPLVFSKTEEFKSFRSLSGDASSGSLLIDSVVKENTGSIQKLVDLGFPDENNLPVIFVVDYVTVDGKIVVNDIEYKAQ